MPDGEVLWTSPLRRSRADNPAQCSGLQRRSSDSGADPRAFRSNSESRGTQPHGQSRESVRRKWRRRPDLNRGWRFCRFNGVVHRVVSCWSLVGPAPPFCLVFGPYWTTFGLRRPVMPPPSCALAVPGSLRGRSSPPSVAWIWLVTQAPDNSLSRHTRSPVERDFREQPCTEGAGIGPQLTRRPASARTLRLAHFCRSSGDEDLGGPREHLTRTDPTRAHLEESCAIRCWTPAGPTKAARARSAGKT